jgi:hypothetical protein
LNYSCLIQIVRIVRPIPAARRFVNARGLAPAAAVAISGLRKREKAAWRRARAAAKPTIVAPAFTRR